MKAVFPIEVPWDAQSVPHATIEVNQMCNIACHGCYKSKMSYTKPLNQVKQEVDLVAAQRNLESITLLGGEPTLHPELPAIIRYIAGKGIHPMILTNASRLTRPRLIEYRAAGVYGVRMHIDKHQHQRPDLDEDVASEEELQGLRRHYIGLCREAGIEPSLALTVYRDTLHELPQFMTFCHHNGIRDVLFTLYLQSINGHEPDNDKDDHLSLKNQEIYDFLLYEAGVHPTWYIPSTRNPRSLRWLVYYAAVSVDPRGGYTRLFLQPRHRFALRFLRRAQQLLQRRRYSFSVLPGAGAILASLIPYALLSFSPSTMAQCLRFFRDAVRHGNVSSFRMAFQELPVINEHGDFDSCKNCPDATVRNGKIIPVCVADHIDPVLVPQEQEAAATA